MNLMTAAAAIAAVLFLASGAALANDTAKVTANFGDWRGYPLVKSKFGVYNSGYVPGYLATYRRDAHLLGEVRPDSLRFDGGLGAPEGILLSSPPLISGRAPELKYDFTDMDAFVRLLEGHDVRPYWCYSYIPAPLSEPGKSFRDMPASLDAWAQAAGAVAARLASASNAPEYHEVYNEPDNRDFFSGAVEDYPKLYEHAARAIRRAAPRARIGGPSLAFTDSWISPFLEFVKDKRLPLDFFSFHYYPGVPYKAGNVAGVIRTVAEALDSHPGLACTEMHLNEYNSLPINYPEDGPQQKHALAADLLSDYEYFVSQPCLTTVHWAQFMDTGGGNWSGMVSIDGHRKASFNAYRIYSMMPVDRRAVKVEGPAGVQAMASSDGHTSGLAVWNRGKAGCDLLVRLDRLPQGSKVLRVFRVDSLHASWGDDPASEMLAPEQQSPLRDLKDVTWQGQIPAGGVVYIELRGSGSVILPERRPAACKQVLHYYPDRRSRAYADFDRRTWTARLGMEGESRAEARVGVVAENLPDALAVTVQAEGIERLDAKSLLALRVDYEVRGRYSKAVLFHGRCSSLRDLHAQGHEGRSMWGTRRPADEVVRAADLASFHLPLADLAPAGWKGRAILTFIMRDAGPDARARITLSRARQQMQSEPAR